MVFPVSLARTLKSLRFATFFSFLISLFIVFAIVGICLANREVTPDLGQSFNIAFTNFNIKIKGIFSSLPLVIFAYMY